MAITNNSVEKKKGILKMVVDKIGKGVKSFGDSYKNLMKNSQPEDTKWALKEMDKKYPAGWAQSAGNMLELNYIKKRFKKQ